MRLTITILCALALGCGEDAAARAQHEREIAARERIAERAIAAQEREVDRVADATEHAVDRTAGAMEHAADRLAEAQERTVDRVMDGAERMHEAELAQRRTSEPSGTHATEQRVRRDLEEGDAELARMQAQMAEAERRGATFAGDVERSMREQRARMAEDQRRFDEEWARSHRAP